MYTEKAVCFTPTPTPAVLTAAPGFQFGFVPQVNLQVTRIAVKITTAVVSTGVVVLTVTNRPLVGSATGEATLGVLNVPAGTVVGSVVYKDFHIRDVALGGVAVPGAEAKQGNEIAFYLTTAAAGGGAAGAYVPVIEAELDPEFAGNMSNFIKSA